MRKTFAVAGIGELLWDIFPDHKRLGGAPANFACHCSRLGAEAYPVSCVGADLLGELIRKNLKEMDVDDCYVMESVSYPTGTVQVELNEAGKPTYQILENVAWDHIPPTDKLNSLAEKLDAVCFGSLSQRSEESRATIHTFLRSMSENSLKIFDVNLRQSFYSKKQVRESLELATILKLSDEELPVLASYFGLQGNVPEQLNALRERFELKLIAYTRGHEGSLLLGIYEMNDFPGCECVVGDTVGAGDSFTAALCLGLLRGWPLGNVNQFANKVAAFVCSQKGATPELPAELIGMEIRS